MTLQVRPIPPGDENMGAFIEMMYMKTSEFDPYGTVDLEHLVQQYMTGEALLLAVVELETQRTAGALVAVKRPRQDGHTDLHALLTIGERLEEWAEPMVEAMHWMAQQEGCSNVTLSGRPGWARALAKYGFKTQEVTLALPVEELPHGLVQQQ